MMKKLPEEVAGGWVVLDSLEYHTYKESEEVRLNADTVPLRLTTTRPTGEYRFHSKDKVAVSGSGASRSQRVFSIHCH